LYGVVNRLRDTGLTLIPVASKGAKNEDGFLEPFFGWGVDVLAVDAQDVAGAASGVV